MRSCKTCTHPERAKIEDCILRREPHQKIGDRFGLSLYSIYRHSKHIGRTEVLKSDVTLVERVESLMSRLEQISTTALSKKKYGAAIHAIHEIKESLAFIARLTGQIQPGGSVHTTTVAVTVGQHHSVAGLSDHELDLQTAKEVAEATDNFNPRVIAKFMRLMNNSPEKGPDQAQLTETIDV